MENTLHLSTRLTKQVETLALMSRLIYEWLAELVALLILRVLDKCNEIGSEEIQFLVELHTKNEHKYFRSVH